MVLKDDWVLGDAYAHSDQNEVSSQVNANTDAIAGKPDTLTDLGVTATAAELNVLDGVTATVTELNYTDGVTSGIQGQLDAKVPTTRTVNGSALSGNVTLTQDDVADGTTNKQYSATEKSKLAGVAAGAEVNVNADWTSASGDSQILNKPATFAPTIGTTSTTAVAGNDARLADTRTPTDNTVTSAKIVDGAIVDADINASAAITLSKLATGYVQGSSNGTATTKTLWTGTAAQYAAIGSKDANTVYVVTP